MSSSTINNNHRWLAERLGTSNDFSSSPLFNTRYYLDEVLLERTALEKGIRMQRYPGRMLEFTKADKQVVFHINAPRIPMATHLLDSDKVLLKTLFKANGIPTPLGEAFTEYEAALAYLNSRTKPQVVKPTNGFASRGVSINITNAEAFETAWHTAKEIGTNILIEDMIQGEEIRFYFINGEFIHAYARTTAFVIGDGTHSIAALIQVKNRERGQNPVTAKATITDTPALTRSGRSQQDIPAKDEWVVLGDKRISNLGSEPTSLSNVFPEEIMTIAQKAARLLPSHVCGVDLFIEDLAHPTPDRIWITEINSSTPAISSLHFPRYGKSVEIAPRLLDYAFTKLALPIKPTRLSVAAAPVCDGLTAEGMGTHFVIDQLEQHANAQHIPVQRPANNALLLGAPPKLGWTQNLSSQTPMESVQMLKHSEWLGARLGQMGVRKPALPKGHEVRILLTNEHVLAAQVRTGQTWQDMTLRLHKSILEIAARIMHALYRPGHALITLSLTDLTSDPLKRPWGLNQINLQPDLSIFYTNVNRPRHVIPALLNRLYKEANATF